MGRTPCWDGSWKPAEKGVIKMQLRGNAYKVEYVIPGAKQAGR